MKGNTVSRKRASSVKKDGLPSHLNLKDTFSSSPPSSTNKKLNAFVGKRWFKPILGLGTLVVVIFLLQSILNVKLSSFFQRPNKPLSSPSSSYPLASPLSPPSTSPTLSGPKLDSSASKTHPSITSSDPVNALDADIHIYNDHDKEIHGNVTFSASYGVFPHGCQWRLVRNNSVSSNSQKVSSSHGILSHIGSDKTSLNPSLTEGYEYWIPSTLSWSRDQPEACRLESSAVSDSTSREFALAKPSRLPTSVSCSDTYCVYESLYYHDGRWFILVDNDVFVPSWRFCLHQDITTLHVRDVASFLAAAPTLRVVSGDTMVFGFVHYTHPTAIGHWWEMLAPMFSFLKRLATGTAELTLGDRDRSIEPFRRPIDRIVLLHLKRKHLFEWVRTLLAVAVGVSKGESLPPIYFQSSTVTSPEQIMSPLEGLDRNAWYLFERAAIVRNVGFGAERTFSQNVTMPTNTSTNSTRVPAVANASSSSPSSSPLSPSSPPSSSPEFNSAFSDAREFRDLVYGMAGLPPPSTRKGIPRSITFQRKKSDRRVLNERALLAVLRRYAPAVHVVEYDGESRVSSLRNQLRQMYDTGLLVSVHTSNLANAPLLPPGSGVLELVQRNWASSGLDRFFFNQTAAMGDIRHTAWVAQFLNQTVYLDEKDYVRVGNWSYMQCFTEMCIESNTKVDLVVDTQAVDWILGRIARHLWGDEAAVKMAGEEPTEDELARERVLEHERERAKRTREEEKGGDRKEEEKGGEKTVSNASKKSSQNKARREKKGKKEDPSHAQSKPPSSSSTSSSSSSSSPSTSSPSSLSAAGGDGERGVWPLSVAAINMHMRRLEVQGGNMEMDDGPLGLGKILRERKKGLVQMDQREVDEMLETQSIRAFQRDLPWPVTYDIRKDPTEYAGLTHKPGEYF